MYCFILLIAGSKKTNQFNLDFSLSIDSIGNCILQTVKCQVEFGGTLWYVTVRYMADCR